MSVPHTFKYRFTCPAQALGRFEKVVQAFNWTDVRIYPHPSSPDMAVAESIYFMPLEMLTILARTDPVYTTLWKKYRRLVRRAMYGEDVFAETHNALAQDGYEGRVAYDRAFPDVVSPGLMKHMKSNSRAARMLGLRRNYTGQLIFNGMNIQEIREPVESLVPPSGIRKPSAHTRTRTRISELYQPKLF